MDPEEFRRLGYRAVDAIAERMAGLPDAPVGERASREDMEALLREPLPEAGADPDEVLDSALRDVLAPGLRIDHPRFFAYVPGPSNPLGVVADTLAVRLQRVRGHVAGRARGRDGRARGARLAAGGVRDAGGHRGAVRQRRLDGQPHRARHGARAPRRARAGRRLRHRGRALLGRPGAAGGGRRARPPVLPGPDAIAAAVAQDRAGGLVPACVVATAGTTGTGAVDPLPELRALCDEHGVWLHVDAAYGGATMLVERGRERLRGLESADSVALDPHKWLFQPLEAGCVLVRDGAALTRAFSVAPAYLRDAAAREAEVNFADRGVQLTRSFRALKLWMTIKVHGAAVFREAIDRGLDLAEHAQALIEADPRFELVTPAELGIVTFRIPGADDAALPERALADGFAFVTGADVGGRTALRLCTINPRTTREDVEATLSRLAELAA